MSRDWIIAAWIAGVCVTAFALIDAIAGDYFHAALGALMIVTAVGYLRSSLRPPYKLTLSERHIATLVRVARQEYEGVEENAEVWSAIRAAEWYLRQVGKEQGA